MAPENTLAAFESALRAGADWLEMDVHLSGDGRVVVLHDETLDATTDGAGPLRERHVSALAELDAGRWFSAAYTGQRLPMLGDVLKLLERFPASGALVELKGIWSAEQLAPVVKTIRQSGAVGGVVVQSFSVTTVTALRAIAPDLPRGLIALLPVHDVGHVCERLDLVAYNPHVAGLLQRPHIVSEAHDAGAAIWTWTVDEPALWAWGLAAGVDGVITNRPDRLTGWLAASLPQRTPAYEDLHRLAMAQRHREPGAEPVASALLATEQVTGSVTGSATDPATDPATGSATDPATDPATGSATDPATDQGGAADWELLARQLAR